MRYWTRTYRLVGGICDVVMRGAYEQLRHRRSVPYASREAVRASLRRRVWQCSARTT